MTVKVAKGLHLGDDGKLRCWWHGGKADYMAYHDDEWGWPVDEDHRLFEKICLEGFQAGLSWLTILRKRENFRDVFNGFDFNRVARFGARDVERALGQPGIVRHRGKIEATINNARKARAVVDEFGSLAAYFWSFEPAQDARPKRRTYGAVTRLAATENSKALSRDLKKRGWKFVGPTTCYAFMQAMGLVNDHLDGCYVQQRVDRARKAFIPPKALTRSNCDLSTGCSRDGQI